MSPRYWLRRQGRPVQAWLHRLTCRSWRVATWCGRPASQALAPTPRTETCASLFILQLAADQCLWMALEVIRQSAERRRGAGEFAHCIACALRQRRVGLQRRVCRIQREPGRRQSIARLGYDLGVEPL